jgi:undecaprenyl-diphosphatase
MGNPLTETARRPERTAGRLWAQILIAFSLLCFSVLAAAVYLDSQPYFSWDLAATRDIQSISSHKFELLMRGVSLAGDSVFWSGSLLLAACLVLLAFGARREAVFLLLVVAAGQAFKIAVKDLIRRPRPSPDLVNVLIDAKEIHSFPSGHTVHYVVFFGFLWFLVFTLLRWRALRRPMLALLGALVLLVGPARVYLGAHWTSDVLAGYLMGVALLVGNIRLYQRWSVKKSSQEPVAISR